MVFTKAVINKGYLPWEIYIDNYTRYLRKSGSCNLIFVLDGTMLTIDQ